MRLWFRRKKTKRDLLPGQRKQAGEKALRARRRTGRPNDDPIKNWESQDQAFLRQAGDPFLDG
jgi:hypothetical protein